MHWSVIKITTGIKIKSSAEFWTHIDIENQKLSWHDANFVITGGQKLDLGQDDNLKESLFIAQIIN